MFTGIRCFCSRVYSSSVDTLDLRGEPRSVYVIHANAISVRPVSQASRSTSWSQSINSSWRSRTRHWISSHAERRPPFARMYTCEASASRAANARDAANGPDPMIRIPLVARRKERMREAPVRGLGNIGGGYLRTISIVRDKKTR